MVSDLLKIDIFNPGTMIVVDGRGANSSFLKDHLEDEYIKR